MKGLLLLFLIINLGYVLANVYPEGKLTCLRVDINDTNWHFSFLLRPNNIMYGWEHHNFTLIAKVCAGAQHRFVTYTWVHYVSVDTPGIIVFIDYPKSPWRVDVLDTHTKAMTTYLPWEYSISTYDGLEIQYEYGNETICEPECVAEFYDTPRKTQTTATETTQMPIVTSTMLVEPVVQPVVEPVVQPVVVETTSPETPKSWENDYLIAIVIAVGCLPVYITMYIVYRRLTRDCLKPVNM